MIIVNAMGKPCPLPVIEAKKALERAEPDTVVEVWVDNEIAVQNLKKLANHKGLHVLDEKVSDREYHVRIFVSNKTEATDDTSVKNSASETETKNALQEEEQLIRECQDCGIAQTVVVISSEEMGNGDAILGRLLMKGFIFALTQQDVLPKTILLYNGGAKWSCEGSEALEDLKSMQEQGTEILTCGTCLNHYGLSEKLAVGSVTNMYEIAEKMMGAGHMVRP